MPSDPSHRSADTASGEDTVTTVPAHAPDAPSPRRRGPRRIGPAAGVVVAVAAVAGVAAGCSGTSAPSAAPSATSSVAPSSASPAHGKHEKKKSKGISGKVQAENGNTWTVLTKAGKQFTVTLGPSTTFGTKAAPSSAAQFPVGSTVRVQGTVTGTTVAAKRISASKAPKTPAAPTSTPAPTATPS